MKPTTNSRSSEVKRPARKVYRFDNLADIERLEIVANDPVLHMLGGSLPQIGTKTKPSATSTTGMLLLGAATLIFGNDDRATAELRAHWYRIHKVLSDAGIPAPDKPLTAQQFIDFRDVFLGRDPELNAVIKELGELMPATRWIDNNDEATEGLASRWRKVRRVFAKVGIETSKIPLDAQAYRALRETSLAGVPGASEIARMLDELVPAARAVGNDDDATAELSLQWDEVVTIFARAGHPLPAEPMNAQGYRRFRDRFSECHLRAVNDGLGVIGLDLAIGQARDMALADAHPWKPVGRQGWFTVPQERALTADGTWFEEQANVIRNPGPRHSRITRSGKRSSDTVLGEMVRVPRTSRGVDTRGKASGYAHVILSVRGPKKRQGIVLDVVRTHRGIEMAAVIPAVTAIGKALFGAPMGFVYDGAMRGTHHDTIRKLTGMMSLNKAHGFDGERYKQMLNSKVPKGERIHVVDFPTSCGRVCPQRVTFAAGMMFAIETDAIGVNRRLRIADHSGLVSQYTDDGWVWELDLSMYCSEHSEYHVLTVDPNGTLVGVALAENLRVIPPNRPEFDRVYGHRNWAEGLNNYIKNVIMRTKRARSATLQRHEFDLRLAAIIANALAWAEHGTDRYLHVPGRS